VAAASSASTPASPLRVLIDLGVRGGRTGVRSVDDAVALARQVAAAPGVLLAGVAGYEGIVTNTRDDATLAAVDRHCAATLVLLERIRDLVELPQPVCSMGGSAFPDRVMAALVRHRAEHPADDAGAVTVVLRSGCYVTHDHGTYARVSPIAGLRAALRVRAAVCSVPEPGLAVVAAGKRDLAYDAGLPVLLAARAADGILRDPLRGRASKIFDHHLVLTDVEGLQVGDVVELGISHPCSVFDRWPELVVLDRSGRPVDHWPIQFH
jgi:D-serine deaminase-like pyridoxal phosphate-dependent protein